MTIRVQPVQDPARGADWSYTIPGKYIEQIMAVAGTLVTAVGPGATVAVDSSGNGNDATYDPGNTQGLPGVVAGDASTGFKNPFPGPVEPLTLPVNVPNVAGDFTAVWWQDGVGTTGVLTSGAVPFTLALHNDGVAINLAGAWGLGNIFNAVTGLAPIVGPFMVAVTLDAGGVTLYLDGNPVATDLLPVWPPVPVPPYTMQYGNDLAGVTAAPTIPLDELATFPAALTGADIAGLYAAGLAGFATYAPAVLALGPDCYYHLDDATAPTVGRTPALEITDGTHVVGRYAPSFPSAPVANAFDYSWVVDLADNNQPAAGTPTTVSIPPLILPGGYTVGSNTPDIGLFDQWTGVAIWWDDRYDPNLGGSPLPWQYENLLLLAR